MARVAREMVQNAGVDVDKLIDMLVRNAAAELTTLYYPKSGSCLIACMGRIGGTVGDGDIPASAFASPCG